jgi:hypothetical protein
MSVDLYNDPIAQLHRIADALERIANALEKSNEPVIEMRNDMSAYRYDPKPTVHDWRKLPGDPSEWQGKSAVDVPEHRLKGTVYENARDGGLAYDKLPLPERRHTIPEGYKRLPKQENCPQMQVESDGSRFCPHGPIAGVKHGEWHWDMEAQVFREKTSGHTVSDTARQRGFDVVGK